jgi:hypothetical protein
MPGRAAIIWLISVFLCVPSGAQEGYYGVGHDRWHKEFYSKLNRNDGKGTCCDIMDCRPTQSRMVGDHYEVKVDGEWTPVPNDKINHVVAPDGGAHVCAPRQVGPNKGVIFCVVLPPEVMRTAASFCRGATQSRAHLLVYRALMIPNRCACQRRWSSIKLEMKK